MKLPGFNKKTGRTAIQRLINEPVTLWVGGAGVSEPKEVTLREPSNMVSGKHIGMVVQSFVSMLSANQEILDALSNPTMLDKGHMFLFASFPEAVRDVIADLVGEDGDYVENEMTPRQTTAVLATYLDLIGFEYLKETFLLTLQGFKQTTGKTMAEVSPIKPPSAVESLSKSPAPKGSRSNKSGAS